MMNDEASSSNIICFKLIKTMDLLGESDIQLVKQCIIFFTTYSPCLNITFRRVRQTMRYRLRDRLKEITLIT